MIRLITFFAGMLLSAFAFAQKPVIISENFDHIQPAKQFVFAEDQGKTTDLNKALKLTYEPVLHDVPNFGFSNSSYWFKGLVVNQTTQWQSLVLEISNPNIDLAHLYVFSKQTGRHHKSMGDLVPFAQRGNTNKYYQFNLQLLPKDTAHIIINVQNSGEQFHVPITIGTSTYFHETESNEQLIYGVYFGFILFVLLLNAFFYYVLKGRATLYYIGYLFCLLFLQLSLTGFGFKYFWPGSVFLANHANPIFASISMFFLLLFAQDFLNTAKYLPRLNKVINGLKYYFVLVMVAAWINIHGFYVFSVLSINALSIICIFVIIPTSIYILKQKFKPARFFITAFVFLIASVFLFVLKNAGIVPSNAFTNYGLQIGSALEVLLLTLAVIDRFNEFRTESFAALQQINDLKTRANIELEQKVEERTKQLSEQTLVLESQKNEIISSIRYAKRIQDSLLPPQKILDQLFDENYFVFHKPKDIVSGDFYWAAPVTTSGQTPVQLSLAAVADCTGHGVPGAFLSIVANNFLKQSLTEASVNNTSEALDFLNKQITTTLNQQSNYENSVKDGMDIALIAIDYKKHKLYYSGANNAIYIFRNTGNDPELLILKPDKKAIGAGNDNIGKFTLQAINIQAGDTIYLFSDGYADQFGGTKDKKLNYKRFKEILAKASQMPVSLQRSFLEQEFENWKGTTEQTDDVCVMGLKI